MKKCFTLVEIMLVIAVIAILAAVSIPLLLRSRISAQETAAAAAMHAIVVAEEQYRATNTNYSTLAGLINDNPPYVDSTLASGTKQGYNYVVDGISPSTFYVTGAPRVAQAHTFYIDESRVLCRSNNTGTAIPTTHAACCPDGFAEVQ